MALVKAAERFDPTFGVEFKTFAAVTARGELRRYYRDSTWSMRVPCRLQELRYEVRAATEVLRERLRRSPDTAELASYLHVHPDEIIDCLCADSNFRSLSLEQVDGSDNLLGDDVPIVGRRVRGRRVRRCVPRPDRPAPAALGADRRDAVPARDEAVRHRGPPRGQPGAGQPAAAAGDDSTAPAARTSSRRRLTFSGDRRTSLRTSGGCRRGGSARRHPAPSRAARRCGRRAADHGPEPVTPPPAPLACPAPQWARLTSTRCTPTVPITPNTSSTRRRRSSRPSIEKPASAPNAAAVVHATRACSGVHGTERRTAAGAGCPSGEGRIVGRLPTHDVAPTRERALCGVRALDLVVVDRFAAGLDRGLGLVVDGPVGGVDRLIRSPEPPGDLATDRVDRRRQRVRRGGPQLGGPAR